MKRKVFLLSFLAVLFAACEKDSGEVSEGKSTSGKLETVSATEVTSNSALLTGQIGVEIADYKSIEFGMLISEKESELLSYEGKKLVGDKLEGQTFSINAKSLFVETVYYYRAYLVLNNMQYEYGAVKSFKTEKPSVGNHQYVDLGLPSGLLWATCNVGATSPEEYGDYFAWGETSPKSTYNWSTYKYCQGSDYTMTKYCTKSNEGYNGFTDNKTTLELMDDAAHVNWGGAWRMPTTAEQDELRNYCTWTWTTQNNVKGYKVVGPNGNSIFLPAAGYRGRSGLDSVGSGGYFWSSSLNTSSSSYAYYLDFRYNVCRNDIVRYCGLSVRPVCP